MQSTIKLKCVLITSLLIFCTLSCKKFYSYEGGTTPLPTPVTDTIGNASGSLQDNLGICRNIVVSGTYIADSALRAGDTVTVQANITAPGKYSITTDTVNGCWFTDTGTVTRTGLQSFTLQGYGKPVAPFFGEFSVRFSGTVCTFTLPTAVATYRFNAPPGSCPNLAVKGMYHFAATLGIADTVVVPVTILTAGTYTIQTAMVNGMMFSAKGIFTTTGNQTITLAGSGRPNIKGSNTLPLTIGNTTCSFAVDVLIDTTMSWQFTAEGITYSGWSDSAYGVLGDTGIFFDNNPNRIFATGFGGFDKNETMDGPNFGIELIRLNTPLNFGLYHPLGGAGDGDSNGTMLFQSNDGITISPNDFLYEASANLKDFTITVTSFNPVSKLLEGTFSGSVYKLKSINDFSGPIINITNGRFKTFLAH